MPCGGASLVVVVVFAVGSDRAVAVADVLYVSTTVVKPGVKALMVMMRCSGSTIIPRLIVVMVVPLTIPGVPVIAAQFMLLTAALRVTM